MKKAIFTMEPFTCPSCVKKIENTLGRTDGVQAVRVMFNSGRVRAEFDSTKTDETGLEKILERLGYPVQSTRVS